MAAVGRTRSASSGSSRLRRAITCSRRLSRSGVMLVPPALPIRGLRGLRQLPYLRLARGQFKIRNVYHGRHCGSCFEELIGRRSPRREFAAGSRGLLGRVTPGGEPRPSTSQPCGVARNDEITVGSWLTIDQYFLATVASSQVPCMISSPRSMAASSASIARTTLIDAGRQVRTSVTGTPPTRTP